MWVQKDEEHLHDALLADRKRDTQVAEGVKGHRHLVAFGTNQGGLEEAVKLVDDHRVVPPAVVSPRLSCHLLPDKQPTQKQYISIVTLGGAEGLHASLEISKCPNGKKPETFIFTIVLDVLKLLTTHFILYRRHGMEETD